MRSRFIIVLLVCVSLLASVVPLSSAAEYEASVWNGRRVAEGEYEAVALIDYKGDGQFGGCSGSLVGPRVILTAAHCIALDPGEPLTVYLGGTSGRTGFKERFTTRLHTVPRRYRDDPWRVTPWDFGLIVLPWPSSLTPVAVAADHDFYDPGTPAAVVGFGGTTDGRRGFGVLREGATWMRTDESCERRFAIFDGDTQLCLDGRESSGCPGDSGGPVFIDGGGYLLQVGVVSGGKRGCNFGHPRWLAGWLPGGISWMQRTLDEGIPKIEVRAGLAARSTDVRAGETVRFIGDLWRDDAPYYAALGFQRVQLLRRVSGTSTWRVIDERRTDADGVVRFRDTPRRDFAYRMRHLGSRVTWRATSPILRVDVVNR